MPKLITEWSTDDPGLAASLTLLNQLPEYSVARLEAEAQLHLVQARTCWRLADSRRRHDQQQARRKARTITGRE